MINVQKFLSQKPRSHRQKRKKMRSQKPHSHRYNCMVLQLILYIRQRKMRVRKVRMQVFRFVSFRFVLFYQWALPLRFGKNHASYMSYYTYIISFELCYRISLYCYHITRSSHIRSHHITPSRVIIATVLNEEKNESAKEE